jgi:hypothetical protein
MFEDLLRCVDHANRNWLITHRSGLAGTILVEFICRSQRGTKTLDQCAAWHPTYGWDRTRWFPSSPRPVPALVLRDVEARLKEGQL